MTTETTPVAGAESPVATPDTAQSAQTPAPEAANPGSPPAAETQANRGEPTAETQGQTPEGTEDESKRQQNRVSAKERIQQLSAAKNQALAENAALRREVDRLKQPLQPPGPNASQDEIDRHNMKTAVREQRAEEVQVAADRAAEQAWHTMRATFEAKAESVADRMPGLVDKFLALPVVSQEVATFVSDSEKGAEVAFFLTQNPNEAARISRLHPYQQGLELARIEGRLQAAPQVRKVSQAPPPPPSMPGAPSPSAKSVTEMSISDLQKVLYPGR